MQRHYPKLDALVVLTEQDGEGYGTLLDGCVPLVQIPNTVRPLPGAKADLGREDGLCRGASALPEGLRPADPRVGQVAPEHPTGGCGCAVTATIEG